MTQDEAQLMCGMQFGPDWEFVPINRHGEVAGFVMIQGNEIHAWRKPNENGRWLTRQDIQGILQPIIDAHGAVVTKVRKTNEIGQRFVSRLGFKRVSEDENTISFKAEKLNHARH